MKNNQIGDQSQCFSQEFFNEGLGTVSQNLANFSQQEIKIGLGENLFLKSIQNLAWNIPDQQNSMNLWSKEFNNNHYISLLNTPQQNQLPSLNQISIPMNQEPNFNQFPIKVIQSKVENFDQNFQLDIPYPLDENQDIEVFNQNNQNNLSNKLNKSADGSGIGRIIQCNKDYKTMISSEKLSLDPVNNLIKQSQNDFNKTKTGSAELFQSIFHNQQQNQKILFQVEKKLSFNRMQKTEGNVYSEQEKNLIENKIINNFTIEGNQLKQSDKNNFNKNEKLQNSIILNFQEKDEIVEPKVKITTRLSKNKTQCRISQDFNNLDNQNQSNLEKNLIRKKYKNESKNVIKTFSYAFCKYMIDNIEDIKFYLNQMKISIKEFYQYINLKKKRIQTIQEFVLITKQFDDPENKKSKMNKIFRIFSYKFLRQETQSYFRTNKKIKNGPIYIKFVSSLVKALSDPDNFKQIKSDD